LVFNEEKNTIHRIIGPFKENLLSFNHSGIKLKLIHQKIIPCVLP